MITMTKHDFRQDNVAVHFIPSKKFKTITVVMKMKAPIDRNTITKRALLQLVLKKGSKKYPNSTLLQEKLDDLYGALFQVDGYKSGKYHVLSVKMELANKRYISSQSVLYEEAMDFLNEVIARPLVEGTSFNEKIVEREKETLRRQIRSIKDDKVKYAQMRLLDEMCKGEPYQIHAVGYEKDLKAITGENLYTYYQTLLQEDAIDLFVVGNFDFEEMELAIKGNIKDIANTSIKHTAAQEEVARKLLVAAKPKEIIEREQIQQAKLHIGYRTGTLVEDAEFAEMLVCNTILGGYIGSKLFVNVREKNSLAYYVSSSWDYFSGNLFIISGVHPNDYEKALQIMIGQVDAMKEGDISDEELHEAKVMLVSQYRERADQASGMIDLFYEQNLGNKERSLQEIIGQIERVQKDDVVRNAKKLIADTIYLVTSEEV